MGKSIERTLSIGVLLLTCSSVALVVGFALGQILSEPALVAMVGRRMRE